MDIYLCYVIIVLLLIYICFYTAATLRTPITENTTCARKEVHLKVFQMKLDFLFFKTSYVI